MLTKKFVLDRNEYMRMRIQMALRGFYKRTWHVQLILVLISIPSISQHDQTLQMLAGFTLIACILLPTLIIVVTRDRIKDRSHDLAFASFRQYEFSEEFIQATSDLGEGKSQWRAINKIETFKTWTLLSQGDLLVAAIPDSAFENESDLNSFRDLILQKRQELKG